MPRTRTLKVEPNIDTPVDQWVEGVLASLIENRDHVFVELMLTDPAHDFRTMRAKLPLPVRPDNRLGQLMAAAGVSLALGDRIDITQAVGRTIRVRFMHINGHTEPVAFAPPEQAPRRSESQQED